jgi:hypothetical protein
MEGIKEKQKAKWGYHLSPHEWVLLHIWNLPVTFIMSKYLVTKVDVAKMWEVIT